MDHFSGFGKCLPSTFCESGAVRRSGGVSLSHPQLTDLGQGSEKQTAPLEGLGEQSPWVP